MVFLWGSQALNEFLIVESIKCINNSILIYIVKTPIKNSKLNMNLTNSYYKLGVNFYKEQKPSQVKNPELIKFNQELADELRLEFGKDKKYLADIFSGNVIHTSSKPISLAYAGHQFGYFVPQLGDGRAILLGEILDKNKIYLDLLTEIRTR